MDADSGSRGFNVIVQLSIDICRMDASLASGAPPCCGCLALPTLRVLSAVFLHGWCNFSRTCANGNKGIPSTSHGATTAVELEITDKELLVYNFILDFYVLCDTASCPSTSRYVLSGNF